MEQILIEFDFFPGNLKKECRTMLDFFLKKKTRRGGVVLIPDRKVILSYRPKKAGRIDSASFFFTVFAIPAAIIY